MLAITGIIFILFNLTGSISVAGTKAGWLFQKKEYAAAVTAFSIYWKAWPVSHNRLAFQVADVPGKMMIPDSFII